MKIKGIVRLVHAFARDDRGMAPKEILLLGSAIAASFIVADLAIDGQADVTIGAVTEWFRDAFPRL
jgi:hypothetical protein